MLAPWLALLGLLGLAHAATCPTGGKTTSFTEKFAKASPYFTFEAGWPDQVKYSKSSGVTMTISEKRSNIVFASKKLWTPPVSFEVDMMASTASGVASAVTWRGYQARADEIDLEFVGGSPYSMQTVAWSHADRQAWDTSNVPFNPTTQFHKYKLAWYTNGTIGVSVDGRLVRRHVPRPGQPWPKDPMPIRFGPWAASNLAGWAGPLDWNREKYPKMRIRSIKVNGCAH